MSTIKSSSANLTLNADGSGNDIKFQSNAVEKASLTDGGVFTATTLVDGAGGVVTRPNVNPLVINGDMKVAQRTDSKASITSSDYYTVDRWRTVGSNFGTWTQTQESLSADEAYEDGFANALKMDCTTADASLGASHYARIQYGIEGRDLQMLKFGSSTAEKLTVSFWVKATKTGTNVLSMYEETSNRSCNKAYTISSTNTWEKKIINFPADTGGGIDDDYSASMWLNFFMAAGTNYTSGTLNQTWATNNNVNRAVGQVNHADSTSNNFHITGVQLEVGEYSSTTLPPFQHESYANSLTRCERYYQRLTGAYTNYAQIGNVSYASTTQAQTSFRYRTPMRAAPSLSYTSTSSNDTNSAYAIDYGSGGAKDYIDTLILYNANNLTTLIYTGNSASGTVREAGNLFIWTTITELAFVAELS